MVSQAYKPVELKDEPATKQFQADLKKYAGLTGVPDYGTYTGYIACDMAITGLEQAGKNPTRKSFVDGIRKTIGDQYDAAGLNCQPIRPQPTTPSARSPTTELHLLRHQVKNGKFVVHQQRASRSSASSSATRRHREDERNTGGVIDDGDRPATAAP